MIDKNFFDNVVNIFKNEYHMKVSTDKEHIWAYNELMRFEVVTPHKDINNKFLFRLAANTGFDRWANSGFEKFFDTSENLMTFIQNPQNVFPLIVKDVSKSYTDLLDTFYNE